MILLFSSKRQVNNKVTSNKTIRAEAKNKLSDHISSYSKQMNGLLGLISTKRLTKYLVKGYSILNGAKKFGEDGSKNYLVFHPIFKYFQIFTGSDTTFT